MQILHSSSRLLEKFHIFTAFYRLSELRSREDLIKGIVENLDYSMDGHARIVLSKALTSTYKVRWPLSLDLQETSCHSQAHSTLCYQAPGIPYSKSSNSQCLDAAPLTHTTIRSGPRSMRTRSAFS